MRQKKIALTVDLDGQEVKLTYDANRYTDEYRDQLISETSGSYAPLIADLVIEWDYREDESGEPVPLRIDALKRQPVWVLSRFGDAIHNDLGKLMTPQSKT